MTLTGATVGAVQFVMGNLDDKLREILYKVGAHNADAIPEIKQVFAEENVPYGTGEFSFAEKAANEGYMTGQEWYERFEKELQHKTLPAVYKKWLKTNGMKDVFEAAKKVAGLK